MKMTTKGNWQPKWIRGGKVTEVTWIGKDVMAWCSGLCIIFYDVKKNQQFLRWCPKSSTGEGACCISSHPTLSIFAYAEKIINPRILVYAYPSMNKISECSRGSRVGYLATTFIEDFLVSVGTYPNFTLIIWSWRTGEQVKSISTWIQDAESQVLRTSYTKPILIAQMGPKLGKLCIWDVAVAGKIVNLKDHEVVLPKKALVSDVNWCPNSEDAVLAITDRDGHIYLSNRDGTLIERIVLSQHCGVCPTIEPAAVCWFGDGIVLRTTFCQIRFYKKDDSGWHKQWYVKTTTRPCVLTSCPFKNDRLFFHTLEGHVMQLSFVDGQSAPVIETQVFYGGFVKFVDFVYPWGHHLVVVDNSVSLAVIETQGGTEISRFDLKLEEINCLVSHPDYPMVVIASAGGEVVFVSLMDPLKPRIFGQFYLQRESLDLMKFSQSGRFLLVGNKESGVFYCMKLSKQKTFSVIAELSVKSTISDLFAFETTNSLRVFFLQRTAEDLPGSNQTLVYEIFQEETEFRKNFKIINFRDCFRNLEYVPGNPFLLIGTPCQTRQLHVLNLHNWQDLSIDTAINSGHQMKKSALFCDRNWITSSGIDGLVIVRDKTIQIAKIVLMTHHRKDGGVIKSMVKPSGDFLVALGADGSLVSLRYSEMETNAKDTDHVQEVIYTDFGSQKIFEHYRSLDPVIFDMLSRPLQEFAKPQERRNMTWKEWIEKKKIHEEEVHCATKRASILSEFESLRTKIVKLIDENETCPEIEKLPISAFDVDKVSREQKTKAAKDEREDTRLELEHNCTKMDQLSDWIKTKYWDSQVNLAKSIFSIFGTTEVENYATDSFEPYHREQQRWAVFNNDIIKQLRKKDSFAPWRLYTTAELSLELEKVGRLPKEDEKERMDALLEAQEEEAQSTTDRELENQLESEGLTTYRFVEPCNQISQFACYSYSQFRMESVFQEIDATKLREFWNRHFEEMFDVKEREMALIRERIEKIEYIDHELRLMFDQTVPEMPIYPQWQLKENPEKIIKVYDHEVPAKPYISPSEQEILDQKAAEAERIRLLLLADDFREKALMRMMDGVLEVRWEDIIKKDIPKPACMLKPADQLTKEDLLAIKQYEKDVETLSQEREKYRKILEADFTKVQGMLREGIDKFNSRLEEAFQLRMKVESAIKQQNLKNVRFCLRHLHRLDFTKKEDDIREEIEKFRKSLLELNNNIHNVQTEIQDLQIPHGNFCLREKMMEKKFKSEFPGLKKGVLEKLYNHYKRRPRILLKTLTPNDFVDLGNAAVMLTKPVHLPAECLDYLKSLDHLDTKSGSLPPSVTANHWETFVHLRRLKIDIEMKIRSQELEISNANNTLLDLNKNASDCRLQIETLKKKLSASKQERIDFESNIEIQLVLKMGQVEIKPQLTSQDSKNSVLIPRSEILTVNEKILEIGSQKLNVIKRALNFKKGIARKEWEHKCLQMKIADLKEDLYSIERIQVTKQIQLFLKRRAMGFPDDKTPQHLEKQLEATKRASEKLLRDWIVKLDEVEKRIQQVRMKNETLDSMITKMNVVTCEMEMKRDLVGEAKRRELLDKKMTMLMKRSNLVRRLQDGYAELLALQKEHESLKMKTFPELSISKAFDDNVDSEKKILTNRDKTDVF